MNSIDKGVLRHNYKYFCENLDIEDCIPSLIQKKILFENHVELIEHEPGRYKKVERFLKILPLRGPEAFDVLISICDERCIWISEQLRKTKQELGLPTLEGKISLQLKNTTDEEMIGDTEFPPDSAEFPSTVVETGTDDHRAPSIDGHQPSKRLKRKLRYGERPLRRSPRHLPRLTPQRNPSMTDNNELKGDILECRHVRDDYIAPTAKGVRGLLLILRKAIELVEEIIQFYEGLWRRRCLRRGSKKKT